MSQDLRDQLIGVLLRPPPPVQPPEQDLAPVLDLYITLDPELEDFLVMGLPRLLRQLRHRSERERVQSLAEARGALDFPSTWKLRASRGPGAVVTRRPVQRWDLPENRLLIHLCQDLKKALKPASRFSPLRVWDRRQRGLEARRRVAALEQGLLRVEQAPRLQGLSPPEDLDEAIRRAQDTGQAEYLSLATLVQRRRALRQPPDLASLSLPPMVVLPITPGDLDEAWLFVARAQLSSEHPNALFDPAPQPRADRRPVSGRRRSNIAMAV